MVFWEDKPASKLANGSRGASVTEERLTETGPQIIGRGYPKDRPIIDHLEEGEQPHHLFFNKTKGVTLTIDGTERKVDPVMSHNTFALLTDRRVIVIVPQEPNDVECGVYYKDAHAARFQTGAGEHQMDIATGDDGLTFFINNSIGRGEVASARGYVGSQLSSEKVSGSIIEHSNFETVDDALDLNIDVGVSGPTTVGTEHAGSHGKSTARRSENRAEIEEQELIEKLRGLDAYSFEELVADIWKQRGWEAAATEESGDRGIDVIAERRDPIPEKQLIQAKRYGEQNTVGSSDIQQYSSLRQQEDGVDSVVVVTTSTFTKQAEEIAENLNVKLVDGSLLCEIIRLEDAYDIVRWHAGERGLDNNAENDTEGDTTEGSSEQDAAGDEDAAPDPVEEIRRVRELMEEGILSEDEFKAKKEELLDRI